MKDFGLDYYNTNINARFCDEACNSKNPIRRWFHRKRHKIVNEWMKQQDLKNKIIVDLACGSCTWNVNKFDVIGVDILKVGLDKAGKYGILSSKDAIHEDGFTYLGKQPNESLDLITAFRIMSGFPVERLITESQRVLKKGGQLLVTATLDGREDLLRVASSGKVYTGIAPCAEATQFVYTKR